MPEPEPIDSISSGLEVKGIAAAEPQLIPDANGRREERDFANKEREENLRGLKNDNNARVDYAERIFRLISLWLCAILLILLLQGFLGKAGLSYDWTIPWFFGVHTKGSVHFDLSSEVMLALIGGTTVSVLGIFTFVAKYLFPEKK